jgi:hypothetical protein
MKMKKIRPTDENACDRIESLHSSYWTLRSKIEDEKNPKIKLFLQKKLDEIGNSLSNLHKLMCDFEELKG